MPGYQADQRPAKHRRAIDRGLEDLTVVLDGLANRLATMSECLQQIVGRRGSLPIDLNAAGGMSPYSTEHLAMIELLVACPAHQAVRTT